VIKEYCTGHSNLGPFVVAVQSNVGFPKVVLEQVPGQLADGRREWGILMVWFSQSETLGTIRSAALTAASAGNRLQSPGDDSVSQFEGHGGAFRSATGKRSPPYWERRIMNSSTQAQSWKGPLSSVSNADHRSV